MGFLYPQQPRDHPINYRTQPQIDSRYQTLLYSPPAYTSQQMNVPVPYTYRNLSSYNSTSATNPPADDDVGHNNQPHPRDT